MKRKIIIGILQNSVSTFIPLFCLQFFIIPNIASRITVEAYGEMLLITSLISLFSVSFGNVLNNSRLIKQKDYNFTQSYGDYSVILTVFLIINIIIFSVSMLLIKDQIYINSFDYLLILSCSTLFLVISYASVEFRLKLNYGRILLDGIFLLLGYLVGYIVFLYTNNWLFIYLIGYLFSFMFILKTTSILREKLKISPIFKKTFSQTLLLLISGVLVSLGAYIDRLIIFPLMGAEVLSIYYVSSIFGKTISLGLTPITNVLLSYISQFDSFSKKNFKFLIISVSMIGIIGYILIIIFSKVILTFLYPQFVNEAIQYIPVTSLATIVTMIIGFINPIILRFTNSSWQLIINSVYLFVYIFITYLLQVSFGLMGFCYGILISSLIKLIALFIVYFINQKRINFGSEAFN